MYNAVFHCKDSLHANNTIPNVTPSGLGVVIVQLLLLIMPLSLSEEDKDGQQWCNNNGALLIARVRGAAVASIVTVIVAATIAIQSASCLLLHLPLSLPRQNWATILAHRLGGEEEMRLTPLVIALAVACPRR